MTLKKFPGVKGSHDYKVIRLPFQVKDIFSVYIGKQGCACGCSGKYYYKDISKQDSCKITGDQKKNNRMIKWAYNKVKKARTSGIQVIEDYIYSLEGETRAVRLYLHD